MPIIFSRNSSFLSWTQTPTILSNTRTQTRTNTRTRHTIILTTGQMVLAAGQMVLAAGQMVLAAGQMVLAAGQMVLTIITGQVSTAAVISFIVQ
jgi:hypothetical protein